MFSLQKKKKKCQDVPGGPVAKNFMLPLQRAELKPSMVRELDAACHN